METLIARPVVYNRPAIIPVGGGQFFREIVAPGSLTKVLADPKKAGAVVFLRDHNPTLLLGRVKAGTLRLTDRPTALEARVDLPNTALGNETAELVRRGDLAGGSFRFQVKRDTWFEGADGTITRLIEEIGELADVCACTWPAYEETSLSLASARSAPRSGAGAGAAAARQRRLELLERKGRPLEVRSPGKPIERPPFAIRRRAYVLRGCGHCTGEGRPSMFAGAGIGL